MSFKAELEIASLHEKMDRLIQHQWEQLLEMQRTQLELLQRIVEREVRLAGSLQS